MKKDKYLNSNISMIIPCLFNNLKPNDIEKSIFNLKNNSNNGKEILGRKYYFSFIPKGIYENLFNKICKSIGSTMRFWKNGFIVTSNNTYLTLEIVGNENNIIFIQSIGSLNYKFISSFHFIIEDLFKNEYPFLWIHNKIEIYYKCLNKFNSKRKMNYF